MAGAGTAPVEHGDGAIHAAKAGADAVLRQH